jgi:hypothetical protein
MDKASGNNVLLPQANEYHERKNTGLQVLIWLICAPY